MQAIYAYKQAEKSGYDVAKDMIGESFEQVAFIEGRDVILPEKQTAVGVALFEAGFAQGKVPADLENPQAQKAATEALSYYYYQLRKDKDFVARNMIIEAERVYKHYLSVLSLLLALSEQVQAEENEKEAMHIKPVPIPRYMLKLLDNTLLQTLKNYRAFEVECIKHDISWAANAAFVRKLYRDSLKNDEKYTEYVKQHTVSPEEEEKLLRHIAKNIILKNELTNEFLEEEDLAWSEDRDVIYGMVTKTLKSLQVQEPELSPLSSDWPSDRQFFKDLFEFTLAHEKDNEQLISPKLQNWDMSRVAITDNIMLQMALTEMLYFPSIPVKATINEYIELSKVYSTPQSKQFINGVLDALSTELNASGKIRKSGRGLIDNQ
jgi:N utilization substance protein B